MTENQSIEDNQSLLKKIFRRKKESNLIVDPGKRELKRVLGLADLVYLGVGSTLGLGAYVLAGEVAVKYAGPAVVLSFIFAAIASAFSGLCYAEFASRVPKAGSAYAFSYVGVGEIVAFLIGWDLILEYSIACASISRALSEHIDDPLDHRMENYLKKTFPIGQAFLAEYPDIFSFFAILLLTILIAWGMQESSQLNKIFTYVNLFTVSLVVVSSFFIIDFRNWFIPKDSIPYNVTSRNSTENGGEGGFLPYGWSGVLKGAATCFYGFVGFDAVATTGEEAKKPTRDIPRAIVISLFIITLSYCSLAIMVPLMVPYYALDSKAPLITLYKKLHWDSIKWIVTVGAVFALLTNMIGTLFPLPRVLYSMASDGLLFNVFAKVNKKTNTPFWGTIICGLFAATLSSLFNLQQLMEMMSIGTLMAYTLVCICILVLRYGNDNPDANDVGNNRRYSSNIIKSLGSSFNSSRTSRETERTSIWIIITYLVFAICTCLILNTDSIMVSNWIIWHILCAIFTGCLLVLVYSLSRHPQSTNQPTFRVPFVPFTPCVGIIFNIYLMMLLDYKTWIRFAIWLALGILIYVFYGRRNSMENSNRKKDSNKVNLVSDGVLNL